MRMLTEQEQKECLEDLRHTVEVCRSHRPENDANLAEMCVLVQKLASSLDSICRERGVWGTATCLSHIQAVAREAEWRCNDIIYGRVKE